MYDIIKIIRFFNIPKLFVVFYCNSSCSMFGPGAFYGEIWVCGYLELKEQV